MGKKIVGMMVVGNGEGDRWLDKVLQQRSKLVDDMIIAGNNTDKKTEKVIKKYGYWFYRDDREWGIHQPRIKTTLLEKVAKLKPDWVLPSDADEFYDKYFTRKKAEKLMDTEAIAYYFAVVNLWNDDQHYRHDASFWNIRFFKLLPEHGFNFERKNLHCGLAPPLYYKYGWHAPYILKHYGLMKKEDRANKKQRYDKYDPNAKWKGQEFYDKLKPNNDKTVRKFDEDEMHYRIERDVALNYKYEFRKTAT